MQTVDPVAILVAVLVPVAVVWRMSSYPNAPSAQRGAVLRTGLWGALTVVPVVICALPLLLVAIRIPQPAIAGPLIAFGAAALPEEFFKYQVVRRFALRHIDAASPRSGILFGVTASLGFATVENIGYALQGGVQAALYRALTAIPMHTTLGIIMGCFAWRAAACFAMCALDNGSELERGRSIEAGNQQLMYAFLLPFLLHGLYDTPLVIALVPVFRTGVFPEEPTPGMAIAMALTFLVLFVTMFAARRVIHTTRTDAARLEATISSQVDGESGQGAPRDPDEPQN